MRFECVIFDLDGVLVDTAKYHYLAWKKMAEALGIALSKETNEKLKGVSRTECLDIILSFEKSTHLLSQEEKMNLTNRKNDIYLSYIKNMTAAEILPEAVTLLNFLKKHRYKISLGSASKNARTILDKIGIRHFFDHIVDGNMVTETKPNPEVFLLSAEKFGINPRACIVFEDSIAGIQAGNRARMFTIGVGSKEKLNEAKLVIGSIRELDMNMFHR